MRAIIGYAEHLFKEARHNAWSLVFAKGGQTTKKEPNYEYKEKILSSGLSSQEKERNHLHLEMEELAMKQYESITSFASSKKEEEQSSNPLSCFKSLSLHDWLTFWAAWLALYADFLDSITMAVCIHKLSLYYKISATHFSLAITLSLLFRPIGGIVFGLLSDLCGRRWPLAVDLFLLATFQLASIYANSFSIFLLIRVFASICMGGFYGMTSQVYDTAPAQARGLLGGILQCAISCAAITALGLNMAFGAKPESFKPMFWVGIAVSYFAALVRILLPESPQFRQKENNHLIGPGEAKYKSKIKLYFRQFKTMFSQSRSIFIYCTIFVSLNAWINGSFSAPYFLFLMSEKGLSNATASKVVMICCIGPIMGMLFSGTLSQISFFGRRRMAVFCASLAICLLPAAVLPNSVWGLTLGCNFFYLFLHGYSGVMHSHLNELSPVGFRAFFTGTVQQFGTMLAAPATQIVTAIAESHKLKGPKGTLVHAYSPTIAIAAAICLFLKIIWVSIGPEHRDADLQNFTPAENKMSGDEQQGK